MKRMLNVGGGSKTIPIPDYFQGWEHLLLDISPAGSPDIVCDARRLADLPAAQFDAVYCSHNLEHYFKHDVGKVLRGFLHVLRDDGFAHICVPEIGAVMRRFVSAQMDIEDKLYDSAGGPITVHDVIYGWARQIEASGVDFYAHKTGFTEKSLRETLKRAGFAEVYVASIEGSFEVQAVAFKGASKPEQRTIFGI